LCISETILPRIWKREFSTLHLFSKRKRVIGKETRRSFGLERSPSSEKMTDPRNLLEIAKKLAAYKAVDDHIQVRKNREAQRSTVRCLKKYIFVSSNHS
jgi:hypothetical protein